VAKATHLALAAAALCMAAAPAPGQTLEKEKVDSALTGKITVIDEIAHTLALQGANGERTVVGVDEHTTIMSGPDKVGLDGLRAGDWVAVDADRSGDSLKATYIEVVDDPSGD
jgi:hypothetical protein